MIVKLALDLLEHGADLSHYRQDVIDELELEKLMIPYYIQPEYYETIDTDSPLLDKLELLIKENYQANLLFRDKAYHIEPYKIANFDGIWYLYAKDIQDNRLKTWPIREIEDIERTQTQQKYDKKDTIIESELEALHSAYFVQGEEIRVVIRVYAEAAYLFGARDYVKDQEILEGLDDGSLLVAFTVSTYKDIDDIVKSHIPHIEIVEPLAFREKFTQEIKAYMHRLEAEV